MPYQLTDRLGFLLNEAKKTEPDILEGLNSIAIPPDVILSTMHENLTAIERPGNPMFDQYNLLSNQADNSRFRMIFLRNPLRLIYLICIFLFAILYFILTFPIPLLSIKTWVESNTVFLISGIIIFLLYSTLRLAIRQGQKHKDDLAALKSAGNRIDSEILENGVKPFLRSFINEKRPYPFETLLRNRSAPGLWAIMDSTYEVATATKKKVERMVNSLAGGSIGIAGPRGVGKSTLLLSLCQPDQNNDRDRSVITVLTSVPVKYDAKEFILHLFSQVCEKVILKESETYPQIYQTQRQRAYARAREGFLQVLSQFREVFYFAFVIGTIGINLSLFWAYYLAIKTNSLSSSYSLTSTDLFFNVLNKLTSPSDVFKISSILLIIPLFYLFQKSRIKSKRARPQEKTRLMSSRDEARRESFNLVRGAEICLENIRYQLSFTAGWSGGVKLPDPVNIIESSSEYSFSRTRNPLTLPEIVNNYRNFLYHVTLKYKTLIGIDELDKISSSEDAQRFLNEIKAIFGIRDCFYLLSVSDNALSNFERRGIALRDEFDTSFDDVVFLETPNIDYCIQVLQRRIIGFPLPFVYFCYVLSGGLPRDLIRIGREIFDIVQQPDQPATLGFIASRIVVSSLHAKIRAIAISSVENVAEPVTSTMMNVIDKIDLTIPNIENWLAQSLELESYINESDRIQGEKLKAQITNRKLIEELSVYLLYSSTVYQYFSTMGQEESIKQPNAEVLSSLEQIAHAHQMITSSPQYSKKVIQEFCRTYKLTLS